MPTRCAWPILSAAIATPALAQPAYRLVDAGDFGGHSAGGFAISNRAIAGGGADDPTGRRRAFAFDIRIGTLMRLPDAGDARADQSEAYGASAAGLCGAIFNDRVQPLAMFWPASGGFVELGTLGGPTSVAHAVNDRAEVVGLADVSLFESAPFLYLPEPAYGLPAGMHRVDGFTPWDMNNKGQMTGTRYDSATQRHIPVLYLPEPDYGLAAGINDIALPDNLRGSFAAALGISERGQVTGSARTTDERSEHAWLFLPEPLPALPAGTHDLGNGGGERAPSAFAWSVNTRGIVAGYRSYQGEPPNEFEDPPTFLKATIAIPGRGMFDLEDLVTDGPPGYEIWYARAINDRAEIAASAPSLERGAYRAGILTPVCPADVNLDGTVDSDDVFDFLNLFFERDPAADLTADGLVDSDDFFDLLNAFFAGC